MLQSLSTPKSATYQQRISHKNKLIFTLLVTKSPLRRGCDVVKMAFGKDLVATLG